MQEAWPKILQCASRPQSRYGDVGSNRFAAGGDRENFDKITSVDPAAEN
jgi:hypothetical protein